MNNMLFVADSEEWTITDNDLNTDIHLGLPLTDSLPQLNFDVVEAQFCDFSGPEVGNRGPPERAPFSGDHEFIVEIASTNTNKKKYVFSHKLNRIYVDKDTDFSVEFNWRGSHELYVRATCVFADASQAEKRVQRCLQHFHQSSGSQPRIAWNVLHSSRPAGTSGIEYCGEADAPDSWLSVRVRLAKGGTEPASHAYRFVCKNSCTSGINRRAINILFTLEDERGVILGRQTVGARVCACPRRDMLKDEEAEFTPRGGKRRATIQPPAPPPPPTKVKREDAVETSTIIDLAMLNPRAAILGLEVMIKMQEEINQNNTRNDPKSLDVITRLKQLQEDLKTKHPVQ